MFRYNGVNKKISKAVKISNDYELLNYIRDQIKQSSGYDMSDAPTSYIAKNYYAFMRKYDITVKVYYPKWRFSKAYGYFSSSNPRVININGYKFPSMDLEMLVSLFFHESGHVWDALQEMYSVNHGSNSPTGKENTFQYSLNRYVYEYFNYEKKVSTFTPWYYRLLNRIKRWF